MSTDYLFSKSLRSVQSRDCLYDALPKLDCSDCAGCTVEYNVLYQPSHIHELAEVIAMLDNSLLNTLRQNYSGNGSAQNPSSLLVANQPLPFAQLRSASDFLVIMLMTIGLLIVPPVLGAQVAKSPGICLQCLMNLLS